MRFPLALCALFLATASSAATVSVGCPGGTPGDYPSITAALAALDVTGPHHVSVSGTCTETVQVNARERLTVEGPATVIGAGNQPAFNIRNGGPIVLRKLTTRGLSAAISAGSTNLTLTGVVAENANNFALDAFGGTNVNLGGPNAADAVTLRNSGGGMRCEACVAFFSGWVTIENTGGNSGLVVDSGRVEVLGRQPASSLGPAQGGPTTIRNNFNGVSVTNGGHFEMARANAIENNSASGIILTSGGTAALFGSVLPDGTPSATTLQGNQRNAATVLWNSTFRAQGPHQFLNNGAANVDFHAAISGTHSSVIALSGVTISGTVGPAISADAMTTVRLDASTIAGNSEEGVLLLHGSLLESIANNSIAAPSVTCDGTSIVFGNLAGVAPFECEKATKK